ncbi:hypothetical protein KIPB_008598 [Kipferlia bialata]|uniref:Ankyrin repeat-containing domain-containing protein n=1 Tax=Kipferlia bialata TaxID=797122 RepID=A0A9K3GKV4_9EUKA|nr:hypothetical protein KIPB_008598 [Kipferlia bialata]|eukprot:g8598.t1
MDADTDMSISQSEEYTDKQRVSQMHGLCEKITHSHVHAQTLDRDLAAISNALQLSTPFPYIGGMSILHRLAISAHPESVSLLNAKYPGLNMDTMDLLVYGNTPLHYAVLLGRVSMAEQLIAGRACPNTYNKQGLTPLHIAALQGDAACVSLLLLHGADPLLPVRCRERGRERVGLLDVLALPDPFISASVIMTLDHLLPVHLACLSLSHATEPSGPSDLVDMCIGTRPMMISQYVDDDGCSALRNTAVGGLMSVATLCSACPCVNGRHPAEWGVVTPLNIACLLGCDALVQLLCTLGAVMDDGWCEGGAGPHGMPSRLTPVHMRDLIKERETERETAREMERGRERERAETEGERERGGQKDPSTPLTPSSLSLSLTATQNRNVLEQQRERARENEDGSASFLLGYDRSIQYQTMDEGYHPSARLLSAYPPTHTAPSVEDTDEQEETGKGGVVGPTGYEADVNEWDCDSARDSDEETTDTDNEV